MELTEHEAVELTLLMWRDIASGEARNKYDWLSRHDFGDEDSIMHRCFLCEYASKRGLDEKSPFPPSCHLCSFCPLFDSIFSCELDEPAWDGPDSKAFFERLMKLAESKGMRILVRCPKTSFPPGDVRALCADWNKRSRCDDCTVEKE